MPWGQPLMPDLQNELSTGWILTRNTAFYWLGPELAKTKNSPPWFRGELNRGTTLVTQKFWASWRLLTESPSPLIAGRFEVDFACILYWFSPTTSSLKQLTGYSLLHCVSLILAYAAI